MHTNKKNIPESTLNFLSNLVKFSFLKEGKFIIDNIGNVLLSNTENLKIEVDKGQNLIAFLSPYTSQLSASQLDKIKTSNTSFEEVFSMPKKALHFRVLIAPILIEESSLFLVQILDVSTETNTNIQLAKQRKRVENEMLLRTQEIIMTDEAMASDGGFLGNFLRGLRHDLVSPITQLKGIIQYYKIAKDIQKKERASELIDNSLQKLSNTAKGFSAFVDLHFLPTLGQEELFFEEICKTSCTILETEIQNSDAQINMNFERVGKIIFNKNLLESIFYNLLSNAIKFRSENRKLEINIRTFSQKESIILEIEDNGIGIDLDKYGHTLFEPFKRMNMDRMGSGIGLSLVKNILRKNNGQIQMESQPDKGCKVIVIFSNNIDS